MTIPVTANLLSRTPVALGNAKWWAGADHPYNIHYISLGSSNYVKANMVRYSDNTPSELFTKQRVVSSGLRVFKTSASESESGVMTMSYSRDGTAMDESASFGDLFNRQTEETSRCYLAGKFGTLRSQIGFVS